MRRPGLTLELVAQVCARCGGAAGGDCQVPTCPLYGLLPGPAGGDRQLELRRRRGAEARPGRGQVPRRRLSLAIVRRYCRECMGGALRPEDCGDRGCPFYPHNRWGGGA